MSDEHKPFDEMTHDERVAWLKAKAVQWEWEDRMTEHLP